MVQDFLVAQRGVAGALVWSRDAVLEAMVTVEQDAECSERELRKACLLALGVHQTPRRIGLRRVRRLAA